MWTYRSRGTGNTCRASMWALVTPIFPNCKLEKCEHAFELYVTINKQISHWSIIATASGQWTITATAWRPISGITTWCHIFRLLRTSRLGESSSSWWRFGLFCFCVVACMYVRTFFSPCIADRNRLHVYIFAENDPAVRSTSGQGWWRRWRGRLIYSGCGCDLLVS